ncbi:MAG: PQQ-binding-like beta-propeller repeat protein [Halobacteriales archaeon]
MRRRCFLKLVGASAAVGASGCVGGNGGDSVWSHGVGGHADVVYEGTVYGRESWQDGDGSVFALDASDGTERWTHGESHGMSSHTRPVVGDEGVYFGWADDAVGSGSGDLYAVGFDGTERWTRDVGSVYDPPVVDDGVVYVGADTGALHAFVEDGEELWRFTPETEGSSTDASVEDIEDGVVYAVASGVVFGVDATKGDEVWRFRDGHASTVHVNDGTVYFSGVGRVVACADGEEIWRHEVEGTNSWVRGVAGGNVYFHHGEELRAVGADGGEERWRTEIGEEKGYATGFGNEGVYVGASDLSAFGHDGDELWTVELDGSEVDGLTVGDGYVYAVTEEKAHRIENGEAVDSARVPKKNVLSHVASDGRVYVGNRDGVYALDI